MLPKLSTYFSPLNFENIFIFLLFFLFFDMLGSFLVIKVFPKRRTSGTRILNWLIGFGFFIFIWFLLSQIVAYTDKNILTSVIVLVSFTVHSYFKEREYLNLLKALWGLRLPILVIVPFLPAVFVKASLPPYYSDEMAYHYIPPSVLLNLSTVKYNGALYADLPRTLNLFWELIFSLTKTYSIARLFHFTILVTALLFAYERIRKYFGHLTAFLFFISFISLPQEIILTSTLGYIDVASFSFLLIGLIFTFSYFKNTKPENLYYAVAFWGMNLGSKYTGVSALMVTGVLFIGLLVSHKEIYLNKLNYKVLVRLSLIFLIYGGYWYVKNFVLYGNPIFPFIFNCWGTHIEPCAQRGAFFGDWTTPVKLESLPLILNQLFVKNFILRIAVVLGFIAAFFVKNRKVRLISLFLYSSVIFELLFLKYFSGFYIRYHQYMQLYLIIAASMVFVSKSKFVFLNLIKFFGLIIIFTSLIYFYVWNIKYVNSLRFLNGLEVRYAAGKIDIYDWINAKFPDMKDVIRWCDGGEGVEFVNLARYDPDLIWFTNDGLTRVFMIRCKFVNPNVDTSDLSKIVSSAVANKQKFWITSINDCQKDNDVKPKYEYERDYQFKLRQVDNKIICNSKKEFKSLYYFDYTDHLDSGKDYNIEY